MWKLVCDRGRQVWEYVSNNKVVTEANYVPPAESKLFDKSQNANSSDLVYRNAALKNFKEAKLPSDLKLSDDPLVAETQRATYKAIHFYQHLQDEDGHWPADYGGPMFLMPGLVIAAYVTNTDLGYERKTEMLRYLLNHQHSEMGGWGLHIEGKSTMFGTALNYVTCRLLGLPKEHPAMLKARAFIVKNGSVLYTPSWGKFWLSVLGVYDWDGVNSLIPEMWLLPYWLPFHPGRFWCHCRMVYLPMSYCYGHRITGPLTPLVKSLRRELYADDVQYENIKWSRYRDSCCPLDRYVQSTKILELTFFFVNLYEKFAVPFLRRRALKFIAEYVDAEDAQTKYVDIGPVNKVINMLCVYHKYGEQSAQFQQHKDRLKDYLWLAEDGMKMQGYNGSQLWDCAFAIQAVYASGLADYFKNCIQKAYNYVDITQVVEETPQRERYYRHISKGAWPFSTNDHGWPITDCTSEGMKAAMILNQSGLIAKQTITPARLHDAVNVILSFQNSDGGWATYENMRGSALLEYLNPSEVFGDIIVDYSYVECTATCMESLVMIRKLYPTRLDEISTALARGTQFLKKKQRPNGSFYGSWAVCFTYGTWFAIRGLLAVGEAPTSPTVSRACDFLLSIQNKDGGWGESYQSCVVKEYVPHERSQVVNTAWALLGLMNTRLPKYQDSVRRGVQFLLQRQLKTGDWAQEGISGVFNGNCMITYTSYRNVFPIWALGFFFNTYYPLL